MFKPGDIVLYDEHSDIHGEVKGIGVVKEARNYNEVEVDFVAFNWENTSFCIPQTRFLTKIGEIDV